MKKKAMVFLSLATLAFSFELNDKIDTKILDQINATNDIAVIDFFASWCVSCKKELPLINKLANQMSGVSFVGVDVDEQKQDGIDFQKELKITFPVYNDNDQNVIKQFNPPGVPAIYIVKNNVVKKIHIGALDNIDEVLKKDIMEIK